MLEPAILEVKEMTKDDIPYYVAYWLNSSSDHLIGMGVDINKRPTKAQIEKLINSQLEVPFEAKKSYFLTWWGNDKPIGCSNVNQIQFGRQAFMHLHLYQSDYRQKGLGTALIKKSLCFYFENLKLQNLFCEPYALNPSPNRAMKKVGFEFVKQYVTIPGASNFEQQVNQWRLTRENYKKITA